MICTLAKYHLAAGFAILLPDDFMGNVAFHDSADDQAFEVRTHRRGWLNPRRFE